MNEDVRGVVLIGICFYMTAVLAVGFWSSQKVKNLTDFLVAGRRLPYHLAVATLFATWFGAGSCMGASGTAYSKGLLGVIADPFAAGLSLVIAGLFYVAFLRRLELLTVTDIFGRFYSKNSEIFASLLMVPVYIGWLGAQMVALGYLFNTLTGMDPLIGIIFGACVVVLYTFVGGMWAVTLMDFIQVIVVLSGLFMILPFVICDVGGVSTLIRSTPRDFFLMVPRDPGYHGWVSYVGQWTLMGLGCVVGQDLIQRSLASKNEKVAKRSAVTAGICYVCVGVIPITLGLAGRLILPDLADPELVMPNLAVKFLPPLMLIVFMGALISAIMSSADSSLLAATSLTTHNIILRIFPKIREERILPLARITTIVLAVFSMGIALYVKQIYHLMVNSWATLFVGILVPVTAALYWKKANTPAAWFSMIGGTGTWLGYILLKTGILEDVSDPLFYQAAVYGALVSFLSYLAVTFARYPRIVSIRPASQYPPKSEGPDKRRACLKP